MYKKIRTIQLKTGENAELGLITTPDPSYAKGILNFYTPEAIVKEWGNPIDDWRLQHVAWFSLRSLASKLDKLDTYFYTLKVQKKIVGKVMLASYAECAVAGNMITLNDYRGKGVQSILLGKLMEDFRSKGGMIIGAAAPEKGSHHAGLHEGFKADGALMVYESEPDIPAKLYQPGPIKVRPVKWHDYPTVVVFYLQTGNFYLRNFFFDIYEGGYMEHTFLKLKLMVEKKLAVCHVMETKTKAIAGFATLIADPKWKFDNWIFDVDAHPNFEDQMEKLICSFSFPSGKTQCYVDSESKKKISALEKSEFRYEATFKRQVRKTGRWMDVLIYSKQPR